MLQVNLISVGIVKALTYVAAYANMTVYPIASGAGVFKELMFGYGAVATFMAVWAIITVKETDDLSLVEIEKMFTPDQDDSESDKGEKSHLLK